MAVVTLSRRVDFPTGLMRKLLSRYLPLYRWHCGEADKGGEDEVAILREHDLVTGRSSASVIFTELRTLEGRFEGRAPDHGWHVRIGQPTTELKPVSDRILVLVALALMSMDGDRARVQVKPGGNWLNGEDMKRLVQLVLGGEDIEVADGLGTPPDAVPATPPPAALPPEGVGAPSVPPGGADLPTRMLAPLVLMLERPLVPDWRQIEEFARTLDPDGGWKHVEATDGTSLFCGRGTRIMVTDKAEPVPAYAYVDAFERSFWYQGDPAAVAAHRRHATIGTALDTASAEWETIRQVAKVITLVAGILARLPGTVAVHNLGTGTIFEPQMVGNFLAILARDQLPVQLWTYSLWHSLEDGNVSVSTSGLEPFLGHELEAWNAPLTKEQVREETSDLIVYLLDRGPVIGHGDTAGRTVGEKAVRCFLGPSRAERPRPVQSLFLEFREEKVAAPKPDLVPPAAAPEAADRAAARMADEALASVMEKASPALRRVLGGIRDERAAPPRPASGPPRPAGGFGRKGL